MADIEHRGLSAERLVELVPGGSVHRVLAVADADAFSRDDRALLLVDLTEEPGRTFRAVPDSVSSAVGNLSIDNMSFGEYLDSVGESGVYRRSARQLRAAAELSAFSQASATVSIPGPPARS